MREGGPIESYAELGHGGPATRIRLYKPMGLAEDRWGNVYVSTRTGLIWKIDPLASAYIIAGTGRRGISRSSSSALHSDLGELQALFVDDVGRIYFTDASNHVALRIDPSGELVRVAGLGISGYSGDGGLARRATLNKPYDIKGDAAGNLYVADHGNHRIRKISKDGRISTVAGTGQVGYEGDGGPAIEAKLNGPYGVNVDRRGRLLIADSANHVIRRVDQNGTITTIAGNGRRGFAGDKGPASEALFDHPEAIFVDRDDRIYIGDEHNHAIRVIERDGTISTLIGNGSAGFTPDGERALHAQLNDPESVIVRNDGSVLVVDRRNERVRIMRSDGSIQTFAGRGLDNNLYHESN